MRASVAGRVAGGVLVVAAVLVGVAAPASAGTGPELSVSAERLDASLHCSSGEADAEPILLVPGTALTPETNYSWNYARVLAEQERSFCTVELPDSALGDIQVAAEYVVHALRTMHADAESDVDVIGFSQGGMIGRWALKYWPDTREIVDDLVGLAPSNHGTVDANGICTAPCAPAVHQQRLGSQFLTALHDGPETYAGIDYTVAYTLLDEVVFPNFGPAQSSPLRGGEGDIANVAVQELCLGHAADHLAVGTYDAVAYAIALDAVDHDGPADPSRIDRSVCIEPFMPGVDPVTFPTDFTAMTTAIATALATGPVTPAEPALAPYARRA
jgi:pimeloyl-ACP methyl ester carboxylesterase